MDRAVYYSAERRAAMEARWPAGEVTGMVSTPQNTNILEVGTKYVTAWVPISGVGQPRFELLFFDVRSMLPQRQPSP